MSANLDDPRGVELLDAVRAEAQRLRDEGGGRLTADEAGAIAHATAGIHERDERCLACPKIGKALLERALAAPAHIPGVIGEPPPPSARVTDPETSHAAARSIPAAALTDRQTAVLGLFLRRQAWMTDEEVAHHYGENGEPDQSPSGLRTRRHELVELGLLADTAQRRPTASGNSSIVWRLTSAGIAAIRPSQPAASSAA